MYTNKCEKEAVIEFEGDEIERVERFEYIGDKPEAYQMLTN